MKTIELNDRRLLTLISYHVIVGTLLNRQSQILLVFELPQKLPVLLIVELSIATVASL